MLRSSLFTASAFALVASATAQTPQQLNAEKIPGAVKNAGIYHVATGTWTRTGGAVASFGPDTIYSNTAGSGYFTSAGGAGGFGAGATNYDEGGLPGTQNGGTFAGMPNRDEYRVDGFQIGYCDLGVAGSGGWDVSFYSEYDPCTLAASAPDATIVLAGLPAAGGCWTVTVDLEGTPDEFCLQAEGNFGTWEGTTNDDSFGWSYVYSGTDGSQPAGFILTGDPAWTDPSWVIGAVPEDGTNTYYGAVSGCAGVGTGYLTQDFWWLEDPTAASTNCYFFGGYINNNGCGGPSGNPYASFWMEMYAQTGPCVSGDVGTIYCNSNPNSTGVNTSIMLLGSASVAADDLTLTAGNLANNSFGFFITSLTQGFAANPGGSTDNICLAGNLGRFVGPGQIQNSGAGTTIELSTTSGLWSLSAIPTATGPYAAMAGQTTNFQAWHRDLAVGGGATSNFSDGSSVMWTP